jgi:hypothetical protein
LTGLHLYEMELPEVDAEHRSVATRLKQYINDLRMGHVPDTQGWLQTCEVEAAVAV